MAGGWWLRTWCWLPAALCYLQQQFQGDRLWAAHLILPQYHPPRSLGSPVRCFEPSKAGCELRADLNGTTVGPQLSRGREHLPPGLGPWQCWHWELQKGICFGAPNPRAAFPAERGGPALAAVGSGAPGKYVPAAASLPECAGASLSPHSAGAIGFMVLMDATCSQLLLGSSSLDPTVCLLQ